jgi:hypothetical protein
MIAVTTTTTLSPTGFLFICASPVATAAVAEAISDVAVAVAEIPGRRVERHSVGIFVAKAAASVDGHSRTHTSSRSLYPLNVAQVQSARAWPVSLPVHAEFSG